MKSGADGTKVNGGSLEYSSLEAERIRPGAVTVVGLLAIIFGVLGILGDLLLEIIARTGPWFLPPQGPPRAAELDPFFTCEFYLSWASLGWLVISGVWAFVGDHRMRRSPRWMLLGFCFFKLALTAFFAGLTIVRDPELGYSRSHAVKDGLVMFAVFGALPLGLLFPLMSRSVREYYRG